jgi:hypothetical protein
MEKEEEAAPNMATERKEGGGPMARKLLAAMGSSPERWR